MSEPDVSAVTDMLLGTDPRGYAGCAEATAGLDLAPALGVNDELMRFELFDAVRMGIDYRYPISSAGLCGRMAK